MNAKYGARAITSRTQNLWAGRLRYKKSSIATVTLRTAEFNCFIASIRLGHQTLD